MRHTIEYIVSPILIHVNSIDHKSTLTLPNRNVKIFQIRIYFKIVTNGNQVGKKISKMGYVTEIPETPVCMQPLQESKWEEHLRSSEANEYNENQRNCDQQQ